MRVARFSFVLEALDTISLPPYKGSTLRGGFGQAFRKAVCVLRHSSCASCPLKGSCTYCYVFETPPPSGAEIMRKYPAAPHPFVLEPPEGDKIQYLPGEELSFSLVLIGRAIDMLPYFIYSFQALGQMGIGKGRGRFSIRRVVEAYPRLPGLGLGRRLEAKRALYEGEGSLLKCDLTPLRWEDIGPVPAHLKSIAIRFMTPTRIRYDGRYLLNLEFHMLIRALLRRLSALSYFHCGQRLDLDFKGMIEVAEGVKVCDRRLRWYDWQRYSSRQGERMKLGGFVGPITFSGEIGPFWPYLVIGQLLHVGKGTSFGLGRYEMAALG